MCTHAQMHTHTDAHAHTHVCTHGNTQPGTQQRNYARTNVLAMHKIAVAMLCIKKAKGHNPIRNFRHVRIWSCLT